MSGQTFNVVPVTNVNFIGFGARRTSTELIHVYTFTSDAKITQIFVLVPKVNPHMYNRVMLDFDVPTDGVVKYRPKT